MPIIGVIASSAKGAPGIPTIGTATNVPSGRAFNNGRADVTFTPGAGATATSFTVTSSPGGFTGTGAASPISVTGLQSGVSYTFTVTATNASGTSPASAASNSITATTVPQAPTIGTATDGGSGTNALVAFTANATGGSAITSFTATSSPGSITGTGGTSPITVSGLTTGTAYTFTVTATNANGTSTASAASNSVTPALSGDFESLATATPTSGTAVTFSSIPTGYKHLQVRWVAASNQGANAFTNMQLRINGNTSAIYTTSYNSAVTTNLDYGQAANQTGAGIVGSLVQSDNSVFSNFFAGAILDLYDYRDTNIFKHFQFVAGGDTAGGTVGISTFGAGVIATTSAIDSITLTTNAGTFFSGSTFGLYGIKG